MPSLTPLASLCCCCRLLLLTRCTSVRCRFNKIAARNWDRMKATANQAYTMTVKPLVDRLSGDQQQ